jgi:uncharacterized membrane protein YkvA (DUF1232 family)
MKNILKYNTRNKVIAVIILLFAIGYDIMPADFIPDIAPILGWIDDGALTLFAIINFYLKWRKRLN